MAEGGMKGSGSSAGDFTGRPSVTGAPGAAEWAAAGGSGSVFVNNGGVGLQSIESVMIELQSIAANDPAQYGRLEQQAENAGFANLSSAVGAASLDLSKDSRTFQEFWAATAKIPYVQKQVAEARSKGGSGGAFNSVNSSASLSSASQAGAIADPNFQAQLGRTASNAEAKDFQTALNEQQRNNPTVTTTSGYSSGSGSSTSNSISKGTFDPTRFAREYAQSQEGFSERFAGLTFMNILDKAIAEPNAIDDLIRGTDGP